MFILKILFDGYPEPKEYVVDSLSEAMVELSEIMREIVVKEWDLYFKG